MLFNSYIFIFVYLPVTLVVFYQVGNRGYNQAAIAWLVFSSLFFYAWWNFNYVFLLIASIVFNYHLGKIFRFNNVETKGVKVNKLLLVFGISVNLGVLGYFKYANFFIESANIIFSNSFHLDHIILPLAISFFTFQQITYLIDAYRRITHEYNFLNYCLFVVFFPQLIAGPIVHHKEMLPQFEKTTLFKFSHDRIAIGFSIFIVGLFKKVVIADGIALYSTLMFNEASNGVAMSFFEAWGGALSYTFQLYFDFSGYSDMAVGLAYLFGVRLALNFYSPYKAYNIIDFWRRWHITLSRFLRDYLYFPLGGNRSGKKRRYLNLFITMLLGGLWHGAGWTFLAWGALHGFYLIINHLWRKSYFTSKKFFINNILVGRALARLITFIAVVVAWVIFRADDIPTAIEILKGMFGMNGFVLPSSYYSFFNQLFSIGDFLESIGWRFEDSAPNFRGVIQYVFIFTLLLVVWFFPNTYEIFGRYSPIMDSTKVAEPKGGKALIKWTPHPAMATILVIIMMIILFKMDSTSEFLYFQF
jgi:D-alanyl-lipoteichoic acid acyltransferase DltB (MBOAT superfamily)